MSANAALQQAFDHCSALLTQYQAYWQLVPFACQQLPWDNPALAEKLLSLPEQHLAGIDQNPLLQQQHFAAFFDDLFKLDSYLTPADSGLSACELKPVPFWLTNGIGGRKLEQIDAFARRLPPKQAANAGMVCR